VRSDLIVCPRRDGPVGRPRSGTTAGRRRLWLPRRPERACYRPHRGRRAGDRRRRHGVLHADSPRAAPDDGRWRVGRGGEGNLAEQVELHLKTGKETKLANKDLDGALSEFERTLELDTTNPDARLLKRRSRQTRPDNEEAERAAWLQAGPSNRSGTWRPCEDVRALPAGQHVPRPDWREKVAGKLVSSRRAQLHGQEVRRPGAWAICKRPSDVAPAAQRATVITRHIEAETRREHERTPREEKVGAREGLSCPARNEVAPEIVSRTSAICASPIASAAGAQRRYAGSAARAAMPAAPAALDGRGGHAAATACPGVTADFLRSGTAGLPVSRQE